MNNRQINKIFIFLLALILLFLNCKIVDADDVYVDEETGITFTIPDGWKAIGLSQENREYAKERFSTGEVGDLFIFVSSNLYERAKQAGITISTKDVLGYRMNEKDAEENIGPDEAYSSFSSENIAGVDWWIFENDLLCYYLQVINGNMIGFSISKLMSNEKFEQVKKIIKEVTINESRREKEALNAINPSISTSQQQSQNTQSIEDDIRQNLIIGAIEIALFAVYLIVKNNRNRETVCSVCGTPNSKKNKYCTNCGNKIR